MDVDLGLELECETVEVGGERRLLLLDLWVDMWEEWVMNRFVQSGELERRVSDVERLNCTGIGCSLEIAELCLRAVVAVVPI